MAAPQDSFLGDIRIAVIPITENADVGPINILEAEKGTVIIVGGSLRSNSAITGDHRSSALYGGVSQRIEFLDTAQTDHTHLALEGNTASFVCHEPLLDGEFLTMDFDGTGATPVDFSLWVSYRAVGDGAYLKAP
jgi:hypothetical protein